MWYQYIVASYLECIYNVKCRGLSKIYTNDKGFPYIHTGVLYMTSSGYRQGSLHLSCPINASSFAEGALQSAVCARPCSLDKCPHEETGLPGFQDHCGDGSEKRVRLPIQKHVSLVFVKQSNGT